MESRIAILLVEDSEPDADLLLRYVTQAGMSVVSRRVETIDEMMAALDERQWDVILCDYVLPAFDAPGALEALKSTGMDIPFIVISGNVAHDVAITMMKSGAQDYIPKTDLGRLLPAIEREIDGVRRRRQHAVLEVRAGAIIEAAQEGIIMMDPSGVITFWNPAAERILGYPACEAVGRDLHTLLAPQAYHAAFRSAFPQFQQTGEGGAIARTLDLNALRKDGQQITVSLSLSSLALNGGWFAIGIIQDVTEQRAAEERLRLLSRGIDFSPASIVITDPEGNIVYVNRKFEEVSGYEAKEVMGLNPRVLRSGETSEDEYRTLWNTIMNGGSWFGQFHNKRKNGEFYWETASISPVYDGHGHITHYVAVKEDITEKKKIQDALSESEERYRAIFDQSVEGIYLVDIETRTVVHANQACMQLLGYTEEELAGRSIYDIVAGPREDIDQRITGLIQHRNTLQSERIYQRKDGTPFPVRASATVVTFANRSAICTVFNDVTEQKQQVETLRESEERFRLISENVADIIILFETTGECIYASPSVSALGHDPSTLIGRSIFSLIHPEDYTHTMEEITRLATSFIPCATAFRFATSTGNWRAMEAALSLLVSEAGYRIVAVVRDVSVRLQHEHQQDLLMEELQEKNIAVHEAMERLKRMQEGLVQSEKMASLGQLTAGIAHEINNPLAFVSSSLNRFGEYYGELRGLFQQWKNAMEASPAEPVSPEVRADLQASFEHADLAFLDKDFDELVEHTRKGLSRIKRIVEQLRGFAHISRTDFASTDLNQTIEETISLVWNELKYKVTIQKEYGTIPPVECNAGEMQQVFVNLLVNASHAIEERGTITITTQPEGNGVTIMITDTGGGIAEEHLHRIFDPFFTTKPVGRGTGLGLWIVSTIIQKHRGEITVSSQVGQGTTFSIYLPVQHTQEDTPS
jgi:two-component system, NtrC family, sensor kinase